MVVGLSNDLASQFAKITNDSNSEPISNTLRGTIVKHDESLYVQLDGSSVNTPISRTVEVNDGDRVEVSIANHAATVTGNLTNPSIGVVTEGNLRSEIKQLPDQILLDVSDTLKGLESKIDQKVDSVSLSVSNKTSSSTIVLTVDGVAVASQTVKFTGDVVFASDLTDGETKISGDNITTGTVGAKRIKLGGPMDVYETATSDDLGGYLGYITSYDYNGDKTTGLGMMNPDEDCQVVVTTGGARLTSPTAEIVAATNITLTTANKVNISSNGFNSDESLNVTSDRRKKEEISYDIFDKYLPIFDSLKPASFKYVGKNGTRHLGFIAQDVEESMITAGVTMDEFGVLNRQSDGFYGLSYDEFIPILTAKIQQLATEIKILKEKLSSTDQE